ncbi:F0F1 ATP synthase subunit A [Helcococcus kunzii]|uniref:F0F1 ATP synthase subunit A n=1 Tax=Helcococcus kunzii TaxID=40091 RepID=UPI001BAF0D64|nr:FoF1 ATP synthase subunit a [Helcococcus kunzii]QUY65226.1 F0F1 ATP synthase subunit A [Helcococcus kunzii]
MDISIDFMFNGKTYTMRPEIVNSILVVLVLCIISIIIGKKAKKADFREKPKGILHIAEIFVKSIEHLVEITMGKKNLPFAPFIGSLAAFLAVSNLLGLLALKPPTSNYTVPLVLSAITTFLVHYYNIKLNGVKAYLKQYIEPIAILLPINIISQFSGLISMSFRLFGNVLSGVIVTGLLYAAFNSISIFITPFLTPVFHAYFDVFAGLIQTFVFIMLTMVNISLAIGED